MPITEFCGEKRLTIRERVTLFLDVCSAVEHAHQKGIIHRDLKPSNILVSMQEDRPMPKVIDFGISKTIQHRLTDRTLFTRFETFLGTPVYMSPEQLDRGKLDIDTRSDMFSLGVVLYELITARRMPFVTSRPTAIWTIS